MVKEIIKMSKAPIEDKKIQNGLIALKYKSIELEALFNNVIEAVKSYPQLYDLLYRLEDYAESNQSLASSIDMFIVD